MDKQEFTPEQTVLIVASATALAGVLIVLLFSALTAIDVLVMVQYYKWIVEQRLILNVQRPSYETFALMSLIISYFRYSFFAQQTYSQVKEQSKNPRSEGGDLLYQVSQRLLLALMLLGMGHLIMGVL